MISCWPQIRYFSLAFQEVFGLTVVLFLQISPALHVQKDDTYLQSFTGTIGGPRLLTGQQEFWPFPQRPKPPCSLKELIVLALHKMEDGVGSCQQVCCFIAEHFPYYRQNQRWHHTVKCNLGDKRHFIKLSKRIGCDHSQYTVNPNYGGIVDIMALKTRLTHHVDRPL